MTGATTISAAINQPNKAIPATWMLCDQGRKETTANNKIARIYQRSPCGMGKKLDMLA